MRPAATQRRSDWIAEIGRRSGSFQENAVAIAEGLRDEIQHDQDALLDHLRFCGAIPEQFKRDSSEDQSNARKFARKLSSFVDCRKDFIPRIFDDHQVRVRSISYGGTE